MKYFNRIESIDVKGPLIAVLGNFDGFHLGHQELLKAARKRKEETQEEILMITFEPHSKSFKGKPVKRLTTLEEKKYLAEAYGVDLFLALPFNQAFSKLSKKAFLEEVLLGKLSLDTIIVGHDYRFGYRGEGDVDYLAEASSLHGFKLEVVPAFEYEGNVVSSTRIRGLLEDGLIDEATELLGHPPVISGVVVHGAGVGRTLGFATANIQLEKDKLIPKIGVYGVKGIVSGKQVEGFCNIGYQPTFNRGCGLAVEVHIFNFDDEIYGEYVFFEFIHRLRSELQFDSSDALIAQLKKDRNEVKAYFRCCQEDSNKL